MTYNPGTPRQTDIPSDSQDDFLANFGLLNAFFSVDHVQFGKTVNFALRTNPCFVTSFSHGLVTGNTINIAHFAGLVGDVITPWTINGGPYTVTVINPNGFSINIDATTQATRYLENSGAFSCAQTPYGFHKKITFSQVQNSDPNTFPPLGAPYSSVYTKKQLNLAQLFFQNNVGSAFVKQLTQLDLVEAVTGRGVITPWGIRLNFGQVQFTNPATTYNFPVPFTSSVWSIVGTVKTGGFIQNFRFFWGLQAIGLTQFSAFSTNSNINVLPVPGWYLAIGV